MTSDIDILVTGPDPTEVRAVVEAKLRVVDSATAESRLKRTMLGLSCPLGLIITPQKLTVFLETYKSSEPDSIEKLGEFDVSYLLRYPADSLSSAEGREFEAAVRKWLEDLPSLLDRSRVRDKRFWEILSSHILPAIETGQVRAAAPRYV